MSKFEIYTPTRRGRVPEGEPWVKLLSTQTTPAVIRLTRPALVLIGLNPQKGDHSYFIVEADRESGAIRFTPTDNVGIGRLVNPTNLQISVGQRFLEWTGWGPSRWLMREEGGILIGDSRESLNLDTPNPET